MKWVGREEKRGGEDGWNWGRRPRGLHGGWEQASSRYNGAEQRERERRHFSLLSPPFPPPISPLVVSSRSFALVTNGVSNLKAGGKTERRRVRGMLKGGSLPGPTSCSQSQPNGIKRMDGPHFAPVFLLRLQSGSTLQTNIDGEDESRISRYLDGPVDKGAGGGGRRRITFSFSPSAV